MNNNRTIWIGLLVILLVMCCCCVTTAAISGSVITRSLDWRSPSWGGIESLGTGNAVTEEFAYAASITRPARLIVDVPIGDITVRAGDGDQVAVQGTKRAWGWYHAHATRVLEGISVSFEHTRNQVQIKADGLAGVSNAPRSPQVDMTISVPAETEVWLTTNVSQTRVVGTRGDVYIKADVGEVILEDVVPAESLEVQTRVAAIEMTSPIAENAVYRLTSDVGLIALRLPPDSSFSIDASSDIGNVRVEFPVSGRGSRQEFVGEEVRGDVGRNPTAQLYLRSRIGNISVQPAE